MVFLYLLLLANIGVILLLVEHLIQTSFKEEPFAFVGSLILIVVLSISFYFLLTLI